MEMNYVKSVEYLKECESQVKLRQCYDNMFNVSSCDGLLRDRFISNELRIAFCYVGNKTVPFYIRHCICVDRDGDIIDLTIAKNPRTTELNAEEWDYNIVKVFDSYNEYLEAIEEHDLRTDLPMFMEELKWYKEMKSEDRFFQLAEVDFYNYIYPMMEEEATETVKEFNIFHQLGLTNVEIENLMKELGQKG